MRAISLGAVGDDEDLAVAGQSLQTFADGMSGRPADAAVDLVEDQAPLRVDAGKHHLDGEQEARQFAAGSDAPDRSRRAAGIGRHLEGDAVEPPGGPAVFLEAFHSGPEDRALQLQGRQLGHDGLVEGCSRRAAFA